MKKPPSAACRFSLNRWRRRRLRSYQRRLTHHVRHCLPEATPGASQSSRLWSYGLNVSPGSDTAPRGGIDLGGTKIQTVVVDFENEVLGQSRRPTPATGGP